jgi:hypothetical protein
LKITTLNVTVRKPSTLQAKQSAIPAAPIAQPAKLAVPQASVKAPIASQERRRGQRVLLRIRANIHVALQGKATTLDAATLSVTPQGAVVVMKQNLPAETRLVLEHGGTKQRVDCKVARPSRETAEGFHIPLEFDSPAPGFWKINFPPSDWRPDGQ